LYGRFKKGDGKKIHILLKAARCFSTATAGHCGKQISYVKLYVTILVKHKGKKGKGHPCTGTEALYRPYGPQGGVEV
jgi:hypothetical protein